MSRALPVRPACSEVERSAVVASSEPTCAVCGRPRNPGRRESCSDKCRTALSRRRRAEAQTQRDAELLAALERAEALHERQAEGLQALRRALTRTP
jgi:predicted nucleic acid-binding Zn ribbon protein